MSCLIFEFLIKRALDIVFMGQPGFEPHMVCSFIVVIARLNRESICSADRNPKYDESNEYNTFHRVIMLSKVYSEMKDPVTKSVGPVSIKKDTQIVHQNTWWASYAHIILS